MRLRETINKYSAVVTGVVILLLIAAVIVMVRQFQSDGRKFQHSAYFTTDDGKTWFEADINTRPPFQEGGKEAVRAHVYSCNGKEFVGLLERYSPEVKALLDKGQGDAGANMMAVMKLQATGLHVKRPGEKDWKTQPMRMGRDSPAFKCPDGSDGKPVLP